MLVRINEDLIEKMKTVFDKEPNVQHVGRISQHSAYSEQAHLEQQLFIRDIMLLWREKVSLDYDNVIALDEGIALLDSLFANASFPQFGKMAMLSVSDARSGISIPKLTTREWEVDLCLIVTDASTTMRKFVKASAYGDVYASEEDLPVLEFVSNI